MICWSGNDSVCVSTQFKQSDKSQVGTRKLIKTAVVLEMVVCPNSPVKMKAIVAWSVNFNNCCLRCQFQGKSLSLIIFAAMWDFSWIWKKPPTFWEWCVVAKRSGLKDRVFLISRVWVWVPACHLLHLSNMAMSHKATLTGNLEATKCNACYKTTLVVLEKFVKQCLIMIPKKIMRKLKSECILFFEIARNWLTVNYPVWHFPSSLVNHYNVLHTCTLLLWVSK